MIGKTVREIKRGDKAYFSKTISEGDVYLYAGITGDFNPMHVNDQYAKQTRFKARIAHGLLSAGLISAVMANELPGPGAIYISQELHFLLPVYIGDTITAIVEAVDIDIERNRALFKTICKNQADQNVIEGKALCSPQKTNYGVGSQRRRR